MVLITKGKAPRVLGHYPNDPSACGWYTKFSSGPRALLTSTRWLSGPYSSLSNSMTRLLKNEENFLFCLLGWEWEGTMRWGWGSVAEFLNQKLYDKPPKGELFQPWNSGHR